MHTERERESERKKRERDKGRDGWTVKGLEETFPFSLEATEDLFMYILHGNNTDLMMLRNIII